MLENKGSEASGRHVVANHLRNTEQGSLERSRSGCNESHVAMLQERIGLLKQNLYRRIGILPVIFRINSRSSGDDRLIFRETGGHPQHHRQIIPYLLFTATGQQGQDGFVGQSVHPEERRSSDRFSHLIIRDGIDGRITNIIYIVIQPVEKAGSKGRME